MFSKVAENVTAPLTIYPTFSFNLLKCNSRTNRYHSRCGGILGLVAGCSVAATIEHEERENLRNDEYTC